jgi:hypothetical protein
MRLNDDTELSSAFATIRRPPSRLHIPMAFAPLLRQVSVAEVTLQY